MPRRPLTDEQIRAFRTRAVAAATRMFAHEGYEAVTMRSLAVEIGCSPMTPYRYFRDKEDLFAAVRNMAFRRFGDAQARAYESTAQPLARLAALHAAYVEWALAEPEAYRIMFELRQRPADDDPDVESETHRAFSYLRRATAEAVEAGVLEGEPLTLAHLLWANVHGVVSLHLAGMLTFGRTLKELGEAHVQDVVRRVS